MNRDRFRLSIPGGSDIFALVSGETRKRRLIDMSESGLRFITDNKPAKGAKVQINLSFPWLDDLIALDVRVVRALNAGADSANAAPFLSGRGGADLWEVAVSFTDMPLATQELVFQQIRVLDWQRRQSAPDALVKPNVAPASNEDLAYEM